MTDSCKDCKGSEEKPKKRSITSLTLGWLAEKMRHVEHIKQQIQDGTYQVNSEKVAASIVNKDPQ